MSFILIVIFCSFQSYAQKVLLKEWDASGIEKLMIESDNLFEIQISSAKTNKITLTTHVEGETFEDVVLDVMENEEILEIKTGYTPYFKSENDKLAAHKVIAIEIVVVVPERLMISIRSKSSSVTGEGNFKLFEVGLDSGRCTLYNFKGDATLHTKQGSIEVHAKENVKGAAISKKGKVVNRLPHRGKYFINAESIEGDIMLFQTK